MDYQEFESLRGKIKLIVFLLFAVALLCGLLATKVPVFSLITQLICGGLLIVPGLAVLFLRPTIAQLWFSSPGGFPHQLFGQSTWCELSTIKKTIIIVNALVGLLLGLLMIYLVFQEAGSYIGIG